MKPTFFAIFLMVNGLHIKAQTISQQTYWFRILAKVKVDDKWSVQAETDYRRFTNPDIAWQNYSQMRLHYRFHKNWETVAGLGYAIVWQGNLAVPEWRPYQDLQYFQPFKNDWQLAIRGRIEERFIHNFLKTELTEGFGFRLRPRVRVQLSKKFNDKWTARLSEELLIHTDEGFNQSQTWLSIEYQLKHGMSLDLGYMKAFVKRNPEGYFDRDNLRFSLIKNFNL
jgi:Protein of unknown function (DUF2490)